MTSLPVSVSKSHRSIGATVLFAVVYLAALGLIFAPEGSLSSRGGSGFATATP